MKINVIVAKCLNGGIGFQNNIPWYHKKDLQLFKTLTINNKKNAILMGRKTFESLPKKPLPDRYNIIISTTMRNPYHENLSVFGDIQNGIHYAKLMNFEELWVIGGSSIYKYFIDSKQADQLYITEIDKEYTCDTFFPKFHKHYSLNSTQKIDESTNLTIYKKTNIMLEDNICQLLNTCQKSGYWYEGD